MTFQDAAPPRLLAVVHDLSLEPTWKEEWIQEALVNALASAEEHHLRALALLFLLWGGFLWSGQPVTVVVGEQAYALRLHRMTVARELGHGLPHG